MESVHSGKSTAEDLQCLSLCEFLLPNNVVLQILENFIASLLVELVTDQTVENQDDVVSFAKETVLVNDARLVLQQREDGELVVHEHPPLIVLVAVVTVAADDAAATKREHLEDHEIVGAVFLGDVFGDVLHWSSVDRLDHGSNDELPMVYAVIETEASGIEPVVSHNSLGEGEGEGGGGGRERGGGTAARCRSAGIDGRRGEMGRALEVSDGGAGGGDGRGASRRGRESHGVRERVRGRLGVRERVRGRLGVVVWVRFANLLHIAAQPRVRAARYLCRLCNLDNWKAGRCTQPETSSARRVDPSA